MLRCELRFAVEPGLDEKIILPTTTAEDARDKPIDSERAASILQHHETYRYATLEHALFEVRWHTGLRIGAATGLGIGDYDADEQFLELVHRPDHGTMLNNGVASERFVGLNDRVCTVLDDWLEVDHWMAERIGPRINRTLVGRVTLFEPV